MISRCTRCKKQKKVHNHFVYGLLFDYGKIEIYFNVAICRECLFDIVPKIEKLIAYTILQKGKQ